MEIPKISTEPNGGERGRFCVGCPLALVAVHICIFNGQQPETSTATPVTTSAPIKATSVAFNSIIVKK